MRKIPFLLFCLFALPLQADEAKPSEQLRLEHLRVQKMEVVVEEGGRESEGSSVLSRLKTKEGTVFSQEDFDEDLKTLAKEYERVDPKIEVVGGALEIKLSLWVKPAIKAIIWQGNKELTQEKLSKELAIRPGQIFDRQTFNKAFHKLKTYYIKRGFFEAELDYQITPFKENNEVEITINIKEGRSGQIDKIAFHHVTKKEKEELLELIFTKEYSFFTSWLTDEGTHNPEILRHDEHTIISYFQNEGYADAKVTIRILEAKKPGRIVIDIDVDKGALYHVGNITVQGNSVRTEEQILSKLPISKGGVYSPEKVRQAVNAIKDLYGSRGYIDTQVSTDNQLIDGKAEYDVNFKIQEGDCFRVGLIKVFGNQRTDTPVILHEILLTPGEVFDSTILQKSEERLRNIGYFKNVNIYAVKTNRGGSTAHFRDVYVEVEENPNTANLQFFLTFNTTESLSGGLAASESNFNSKGIFSIFRKGFKSLRGGGEYIGANATVGRKQLIYSVTWAKPYFMDTPWMVGFEASKIRNEFASRDYNIKAYSFSVFANYQVNAFVKAGVNYRLRHSFIHLKHMHHDAHNGQLIRESRNGGLISAVGPQLSYDSTDHPHNPKRGLRSTLGAEYAGLGGDHQFLKASYINSFYWSPYQYGVFRLRGNVAFIQTLDGTHPRDLPIDERLFMGGEQSVRGYLYNSIGPKFHDRDHTSRGGMSNILLSAEYDQYLFKKMDGFVFFDAGNAYFKQLYIGELRCSAGFGIKLKVFGNTPLVLGLGYPLNPQRKQDVKQFFFSIGTSF